MVAVLFCMLIAACSTDSYCQNQPQTKAAADDAIAHGSKEGWAAFQKADWTSCVQLYEAAATEAPDNYIDQNMIGNCSIKLKDYSRAITAFKRAMELSPDGFHNLAGLMSAYTMAGMQPEADNTRQRIRDLGQQKRLPPNFNFFIDRFDIGDKRVQVTEFYPEPSGKYHIKYSFIVSDAANSNYRLALESDDIDQIAYQKKHPEEAAAGKRSFSLDGYFPGNRHATYKFYENEPTYAEVRTDVESIVSGQTKPASSTVITTAPPK